VTSGEARLIAGGGDDPRRPEDFDALYAGTPPWDIGRPQPAFLALAWRVDAVEPATTETVGAGSNQAWLATLTRGEATGGRTA
jgi:hypothetical protein